MTDDPDQCGIRRCDLAAHRRKDSSIVSLGHGCAIGRTLLCAGFKSTKPTTVQTGINGDDGGDRRVDEAARSRRVCEQHAFFWSDLPSSVDRARCVANRLEEPFIDQCGSRVDRFQDWLRGGHQTGQIATVATPGPVPKGLTTITWWGSPGVQAVAIVGQPTHGASCTTRGRKARRRRSHLRPTLPAQAPLQGTAALY
jgi:hypothetical protein